MDAYDGHLLDLDQPDDQVLIDRRQTCYPNHLCWKPSSPYSLEIPNHSQYMELNIMERVVHFEDFKSVHNAQSIIPNPINESSHSSLPKNTLCSWFGIPSQGEHTWFGNVGCQVNFAEFFEAFKPKSYLVEIVQFNTTSGTRLLFTTQDLEFLHDVEEYDPLIRGGPWFKDGNGQDFYLTDCRRYNNIDSNIYPNKLEFIIVLNSGEYNSLYNMSDIIPVNHSRANDNIPLDCRKYHNVRCPTPWDVAECNVELESLLAEQP